MTRRRGLLRTAAAVWAGSAGWAGPVGSAGWAAWAATAGVAHAQPDWRRVPVPLVSADAYLRALYERWYVPRAKDFQQAANTLQDALRGHCAEDGLAAARRAWTAAMTAWERLNAVPIGPLVERRSARRIDFVPTRPASIQRAVREGAADMALVGGPAKGLPALEWLLWSSVPAPGSAACAFAQRAAADVADEAAALATAFALTPEWSADAQPAAFGELLNQFIGAVEALRWTQIDKPLKEGKRQFPRAASGATAAAWAARWQALRTLAVFDGTAPEAPVSLEAYLRGRGLNPLADGLRAAVQRSGQALQDAAPERPQTLARPTRELAALKRQLEDDVAPALKVSIGFSDSDGD